MLENKFDIDAIPGERWFPKETTFTEDIKEYWGDYGVCSEVDTLKAVLMRRPGKEIENFNAEEVRFSDTLPRFTVTLVQRSFMLMNREKIGRMLSFVGI